jgi:hypothetical protein
MPQQETSFDQQIGNTRVTVLKTYDRQFAREAFDQMEADALDFLQNRLQLDEREDAEALWKEVEDGAREEWNTFSYFVVTKAITGAPSYLLVSSDWPTAEAFAQQRLQNP